MSLALLFDEVLMLGEIDEYNLYKNEKINVRKYIY